MWLRELAKIICGKSIIIVGSGPNPKIPKDINKDTVVICVKASGYVAKKLNLPDPEFTFSAEWGFGDNIHLMKDLKTKNVIQMWESIGSYGPYKEEYKKVNYQYDRMFLFNSELLRAFYTTDWIEEGENIPEGNMSHGIGVLMICLSFLPKDVTLVGFNPFESKRYYENDRPPVMEIHRDVDIYLLNLFSKKIDIDICICDKELAEKLNLKYKEPKV